MVGNIPLGTGPLAQGELPSVTHEEEGGGTECEGIGDRKTEMGVTSGCAVEEDG